MTRARQNKSIKTSSKTKTLPTSRLQDYIALTKPGIIRGNLLTAAAGFFLASSGTVSWTTLAAMLVGTSLVIASACVCNNIIDRELDRSMERTKHRALAQGRIAVQPAKLYAIALGIIGLVILTIGTNHATTLVGITGFIAYVALYGYAKRHTVYGTHIGTISGATPPVAGYVAVTGTFDTTAFLLFLVLACWQLPHFFSIALYRKVDYAAAKIPVMPVRATPRTAKLRIIGYVVLWGAVSTLLSLHGSTGYIYLAVIGLITSMWVWLGCVVLRSKPAHEWGKGMFLFSLLAILMQSLLIGASWLLP